MEAVLAAVMDALKQSPAAAAAKSSPGWGIGYGGGGAGVLASLSEAQLGLLVEQAVDNFLDNDAFWAVKKFLANAKVRAMGGV